MTADRLREHLTMLYGEAAGAAAHARLRAMLETHLTRRPPSSVAPAGLALSQRDAILITYGDQVRRLDAAGALAEPPLRTLECFCREYLAGAVSGVHLLPFYPYSSDDGFSVIDYRAVDPALGTWADIGRLGERFRLMFDAVINHVSAQSGWFQGFVRGDPRFREYFIVVHGEPDLSSVVRPRALPLLTPVETSAGVQRVWTTFSADQIDLNYANPAVLLEVVDTLLFYVSHGAEFLRLDAIAYLWKEMGTPCIHLRQTHRIIQLLRWVLDEAAPAVLLITETNVPHADNLSYFGDGRSEAQLVYNFALPPLTLHAFHTGRARELSDWAAGLERPSARTTFFNFLASHDGVGVNPARGILPEADIEALVRRVQAHGGLVSYKHNPDGSQSPYELNVNYFDALSDPRGAEPPEHAVARFMAAHAIMLALAGVPGLYFHSLVGSRGWPDGVAQTGRNRTINRQKLDLEALRAELGTAGHRRQAVYHRFAQLLRARASTPAFHPLGGQRVLDCGEAILALLRVSPSAQARALCLHNVSVQAQRLSLDLAGLDWGAARARDLLDGRVLAGDNNRRLEVTLDPYGVAWLAPDP
ncbi:MAG: sugar phosphorylase [Anaerolineales bacterium]|nr:sugar phosphorylase [Anaerolineales bacterium]